MGNPPFPYTQLQSLAAPPSLQFGLSLPEGLWEDPVKLFFTFPGTTVCWTPPQTP